MRLYAPRSEVLTGKWSPPPRRLMNPLWICILAIFVLAEKLGPHGPWLAYASGVRLLAWGGTTLIA